jgi:hypothetical protein
MTESDNAAGIEHAATERGATERTPEEAAREWLALVDAGRTAESWAATADLFRRAVSEAQWAAAAASVREPLGAVVSRRLTSERRATEMPGAPDGEYAVLEFATVFERKRSAVETVTPMRDPDGQWRVSGYYIR